jgi:hypothetical protein
MLYADRGAAPAFIGVPFALICAFLMARGRWLVPAGLAISLVWPMARLIAVGIAFTTETEFLPMTVAGLIGGVGVAGALGIARRQLLSPWRIACAGLIGAVAGLAFQPWLNSYRSHLNTVPEALQPIRLCLAFAVWQSAVGISVLVLSKRTPS